MIANLGQELVLRFLAIDKRRLPRWMQRPFLQLRDLGYDRVRRSEVMTNRRLASLVRRHAVPIHQPLILISQIKRSGGTLLSQLFDGHPECYAHPSELGIGKPKHEWPKLDTSESARAVFDRLFEPASMGLLIRGYRKGRHMDRALFSFAVHLQRQIFLDCLEKLSAPSERDVFDAYFTSYFNAWLNYQTAFHPKKYITAFAPGVALDPGSVARFFSDYPHGHVISIIRNPMTWFPSRRDHGVDSRPPNLKREIAKWSRSTHAIINNKEVYGDRYHVLKFDDLVLNTETTMRRLADELGIAFDPILTVPTYNTIPAAANSSFAVKAVGIVKDVTQRDDLLAESDRAYIEKAALPLYRIVCEKALG